MNIFLSVLERLYVLIFFLFFIVFFSLAFILPYSAFLYKKIKKIQPDLFAKKNLFYYMTTFNSTQFIYYIMFNCHRKIEDPTIKRQCYLLRNYMYIVIFLMIFIVVVGMTGNYVFLTNPAAMNFNPIHFFLNAFKWY